MFGTNPIRKKEPLGDTLQVHEVWYTLQGEGPFGGQPAVFVRLSGCTLACFWCDTEWDDDAKYVDAAVVAHEVWRLLRDHRCTLVVITGGEPLRHRLNPFLRSLFAAVESHKEESGAPQALTVQVETSGSIEDECLYSPVIPRWTPESNHGLYIVCSPKTPTINTMVYARADCFKYVVSTEGVSEEDGLPTVSTQKQGRSAMIARPRPGAPVYVSPCDTHEEASTRANYALAGQIALKHGYRLSLQMHKHVEQP